MSQDDLQPSKANASYFRLKAKCLQCSLHFVLCTWHPEKHHAKTLYCPECGQHDAQFLVWLEEQPGFICQEVPGNALPASKKPV